MDLWLLSNEAEVTDSVPEAEKESVATWHSRQAVLLCLLKALRVLRCNMFLY